MSALEPFRAFVTRHFTKLTFAYVGVSAFAYFLQIRRVQKRKDYMYDVYKPYSQDDFFNDLKEDLTELKDDCKAYFENLLNLFLNITAMADHLLSLVLQHECDHEIIISAVKHGLPIQFKDISIPLFEFIPHFLSYLHEKLNISTSATGTYFSPRQLEKRKKEKTDTKKDDTPKAAPSKKSARLSLQYSSSSPMKTIHEGKHDNMIKGISPIKGANPKTPTQTIKKRIVLTSPLASSNNASKSNFELNSLEDFPSISFGSSTKNPRRIRATTVNSLSFNSSKLDDSTQNSSFLEESCFESQHCDPSLDKLFLDDKRFAKSFSDTSHMMSIDGSIAQPNGQTCDDLDLSLLNCTNKKITPTKTFTENVDINNVQDKDLVDVMIEIYMCIWTANLIPNFTMELYFLFVTLTLPIKANIYGSFVSPFRNVDSCIYFAVMCLQHLVGYIVLLDEKSLNLLLSNTRVKVFANADFIESIQDAISDDLNNGLLLKPDIIKSPMTGIPFQVESDNRKSFVNDKHFYSFSKKRDAFYALVREWQDNYLDPDWNMKQFMTRKVPEIMKMNTEINTHYQFAKLFVAQLLEMCRNYVGNKTNLQQDSESSLLIDLKKRNPNKYQSLQDRLTQPSFSSDPCPKPSFSIVEKFFKEFIDVADSYCFSKILKHVLITFILKINANSFGIGKNDDKIDRSDFAASLWIEIKNAVSELRLLAKFLGYIVFLPYNYSSEYIDDNISKSRYMLTEPLDLSGYICDAFKDHKLLITVPWVVDFFSMADKQAFEHSVYSQAVKHLVCLYQCAYERLQNNSLLMMSLMLHMGWLFDLPHVEPLQFYEPDSEIQSLFVTDQGVIGVDDIVMVDKEFLYVLCPYLGDVKKPLVDYAKGANTSLSGSFRKITPVRTSDAFSIDMRANLKVQLIDSLMRYVSNQVKDVMKFITEKHFSNIKYHISEVIIPTSCQNVLEKIKLDFRINEVGLCTPEELKSNNTDVYKEHFDKGRKETSTIGQEYVKRYLSEKVKVSMEMLLPESTHSKILEVASKVVKHNIRSKLQEWLTLNNSLFQNEMNQLYARYVMSIVKTNKESEPVRIGKLTAVPIGDG